MATKSKKRILTAAEIKEHIERIQKFNEDCKREAESKGQIFIALTPEEIKRKLKRVNSPMFTNLSWPQSVALGQTGLFNPTFYNPDSTAWCVFVHLWVGSGNIDSNVGTFLLNVDTRFPRLTWPYAYSGSTVWGYNMAPHEQLTVGLQLKVPNTVEKTAYFVNCCLFNLTPLDIGRYFDRGAWPMYVQ